MVKFYALCSSCRMEGDLPSAEIDKGHRNGVLCVCVCIIILQYYIYI